MAPQSKENRPQEIPGGLTLDEKIVLVVHRLGTLETGKTLEIPGGRVVRVRPREYCLHADNNRARARWGTLKEIQQDTRHFLTTGSLPGPDGRPW